MDQSTAYEPHTQLLPTSKDPLEKAAAKRRSKARKNATASGGRTAARLRLCIRILSFALTATIVVVLAHAVSVYYSTRSKTTNENALHVELRMWPTDLVMKPTLLLLGAAATATLLSGVLCLASLVPAVRHINTLGNVSTTIVSTICIALWIAVLAYYRVVDVDASSKHDLLTFTCLHQKNTHIFQVTGNMHSLCLQMRYSWWGAVAVGVLEVGALVTVVWGWMVMKKEGSYVEIGKGDRKTGGR
ncbi:hypothetical protein BU26DRAFT_294038 [Trematosphaeria pertusa]|uniref:MARVEL domain-containing protein n=1 Tax=Trematosphaeria pertusa TaxID=390896 RepID=A0A6A6IKH8_9PLEO|nr:uncharacterized protein BU26DRAFT_294038 [Trematosphaeria pertusa]KAF2249993.1 hypothetical protein BU26DRAFT_294038 [Trematosphaeria pertusa]